MPENQAAQPGHTIKNAVITDARLLSEKGVVVGTLKVDYGDGRQQSFGNYALFHPQGSAHFAGQANLAGQFVSSVLRIAGVGSWGELNGKAVRVAGTDEKIDAIGHIISDDWFHPANALALLLKANSDLQAAKAPDHPDHTDLLREVRRFAANPYAGTTGPAQRRKEGKMLATKISAALGEVTDVEPKAA